MKLRRPLTIVLAVVAFATAACSGGSDSSEADTTSSSAVATTSTSAATTSSIDASSTTSQEETTTTESTTTESTTTTVPTTTTEAENEYALALAPDGLMVVEQATGSSNTLSFGSTQTIVINAVTDLLGPPSSSDVGTDECGNGQDFVAIWDDSIMLEFSQSSFIGWSLRPGSTLTDRVDVGWGTTLATLQGQWSIMIEESTLGTEFSTSPAGSGYGGLLSSSDDTAVVEGLWAGSICVFR